MIFLAIKVNGIKKITNLTAASTINDADVFMIETTSGSRKVTGATLKTIINNLAQTKADSAADGVEAMVADEFNANNTYSVGDYVIYNGKLYKFTTAHETGAFDGNDVVEVNIADEMVSDVKVNGTSVVSNGVAEIPMAGESAGAVRVKIGDHGLTITSNGYISTYSATSGDIKNGTNSYRQPAVNRQHESVFYGLAKAAGDTTQSASANAVGTYTEGAKAAIKTMLGVADGAMSVGTVTTLAPGSDATASITGDYDAMVLNLGIPEGDSAVYLGNTEPTDENIMVWIDTSENTNPYVETITGTDVTIEAEPNCRYVCGEVYTISITPPDTGTADIMFTSGSTPAVLTLPTTVKMPEWWNGVEANYTYEICIMDGVYAGVSMWPI